MPNPVFGDLQMGALDRYAAYRQQREKALKEHQMFAQGIEEKSARLQAGQQDVDIAGRMMQALDPRLPKSARQFLIGELGSRAGVDTKGDYFKSLSTMVLGLDPDTSQALKTMVSGQLGSSSPGEVTQFTQALFRGDIPISDLITKAQLANRAQEPADIPGVSVAQPGEETVPATFEQDEEPPQDVARPGPQGEGEIRSFEGQRTTPTAAQQASPQLVGALGLDSKTRYRNDDLQKAGYRLPTDPQAQDKLATDINTRTTGISTTLTEAAQLTQLFEGKPETLGPVGAFTRGVQATVRQVEGIMRLINPNAKNESDPNNLGNQYLAKRVGDQVAKMHGLDNTAENSARIQSMMLGLAYRMAIAKGIPGNRLTNAIIQQHLEQIGNARSPEQFKATLKDTIGSTIREFSEAMRRETGVDGIDMVTRQLSEADINSMAQKADILPVEFVKSMRDEAVRRQSGQPSPGVTPASPTLEDEERTLGNLETQKKQRELDKFNQERDLAERQDARAERSAALAEGRDVRAEAREERMTRQAERSAEIADRNAALAEKRDVRADEREERLTRQSERSFELERERFDYKKRQDLGDAFEKFGAQLAAAFRGGGGGGGVSFPIPAGQDVSAFRLPQRPERQRPGGR